MKALPAFLVIASLALAPMAPTRSEAAIGAVLTVGGVPEAGIPILVLGGLGVAFGGVRLFVVPAASGECQDLGALVCAFGLLVGLAGAIVMDQDSGFPRFTELSDDAIQTTALTPAERAAYTEQLPELNLAAETIAARLADEIPAGAKLKEKAMRRWAKRSAALWEENRAWIGEDAWAALGKIFSRGTPGNPALGSAP